MTGTVHLCHLWNTLHVVEEVEGVEQETVAMAITRVAQAGGHTGREGGREGEGGRERERERERERGRELNF